MTYLLSIILMVLSIFPSAWQEIAQRNRAIRAAEEAYKKADYEASVRAHLALKNEHQVYGPEANFNLNLSYQLNGQENEAQQGFQELSEARRGLIASMAANQNGVIYGRESTYEEALRAFRAALVRDPSNEIARYNYEMLARWMAQNQEEPEQEPQPDEDELKPSNYAKRMKAEADKMVDQFRFDEALNIMERAMQIDETVAYYQEFIKNLIDIDEINQD